MNKNIDRKTQRGVARLFILRWHSICHEHGANAAKTFSAIYAKQGMEMTLAFADTLNAHRGNAMWIETAIQEVNKKLEVGG